MYGNTIDVTTYLGSRTTNSSGSIIEAQAAIMTWLTVGNDSVGEIHRQPTALNIHPYTANFCL